MRLSHRWPMCLVRWFRCTLGRRCNWRGCDKPLPWYGWALSAPVISPHVADRKYCSQARVSVMPPCRQGKGQTWENSSPSLQNSNHVCHVSKSVLVWVNRSGVMMTKSPLMQIKTKIFLSYENSSLLPVLLYLSMYFRARRLFCVLMCIFHSVFVCLDTFPTPDRSFGLKWSS